MKLSRNMTVPPQDCEKIAYPGYEQARIAMYRTRRRNARDGGVFNIGKRDLGPYRCAICKQYHIGHQRVSIKELRMRSITTTARPTPEELDEIEETEDDREGGCDHCGSTGIIVTCCDDLCRGAGECMHGDGEATCPVCHGESAY